MRYKQIEKMIKVSRKKPVDTTWWQKSLDIAKGVFRTLSNTYDGAFVWKMLTAKSRSWFLKKTPS